MRRCLIALALCFFAVPVAAEARVVINESIAGVGLGDSVKQVKAVLGEPKRDQEVEDEIQGTVRLLDYGLTELRVGASSGMVQSIETSSRRQRLGNGVGVGSTRKTLRAKVKRARCEARVCFIGRFVPGATVTTFRISPKGTIASIGMGYVID